MAPDTENAPANAEPTAPCALHPGKEATDICGRCLRSVCDLCAQPVAGDFYCPACARRVRRRRLVLRTGLGALLAAALGVGLWWLAQREEPFDYGPHAAGIHRLSKRLEKDPCDRVKMLKLAETLFDAGDYRTAVDRSHRFLAECGPFPRLLWITHEGHKRMGEYDQAIADASALIAEFPYDKDFRWWRGEAHARKRDFAAALADYRQSLALQPRLSSVPFELARTAEQAGRPCDGIFPIEQFVFFHPDSASDQNLLFRLERLYRQSTCRPLAGRGRARLQAAAPDADLLSVRVNGTELLMRADPESSYLLLSSRAATRLGLPEGEPLLIFDGSEVRQGQRIELAEVRLAEARAGRVEAVVVDRLAGGADGVLGLSFLTRFALERVPESGDLLLSSKLAEDDGPPEGNRPPP